MKRLFVIFLASLFFVACHEQELVPEYHINDADIYAAMEAMEATKTSMDPYNNVLWSEGDQIVAFMKTTLGIKYQIKEQYVGSTAGGFSKVTSSDSGEDLESGQEIDHNVVVYPYSDQTWCMKYDNKTPANAYKLNIVLPEIQAYAENSFANGSFPMVAVSSDNQLTFRNICGGIKLQFKGVDKIKSIKFEGLAGEPLSGKSSVVAYVDGSVPAITMASDASGSVLLDCGDGVQLHPDSPTTFIIAVPPVEFKSGMKITVTDTDGLSRALTNANANIIRRSSLLTFPVITYTQEGVFEIPEGTLTSYEIPAEGGTVEIPVVTNQEYEIVIPENAAEWIALAQTKALREETIVLNIARNTVAEERSAEVLMTAEGNVLQVISIRQDAGVRLPQDGDYIDEYGINHGPGVEIDGVVWAPVNCGYHETDFKYGKLYQWGRRYGQGYDGQAYTSMGSYEYKDAEIPEKREGDISVSLGNRINYQNVYFVGTGEYPDWANPKSEGSLWNLGTETSPLKTEYDPCPDGWRVPTCKELSNLSEGYSHFTSYNQQAGRWFSGSNPYSEESARIFLPAAGWRGQFEANRRREVGDYWSSCSYLLKGEHLSFSDISLFSPYIGSGARATGMSVRCVKILSEVTVPAEPPVSGVMDLSQSGTANSYIVSSSGSYKFIPTKGNSTKSIGSISSVEVLWETFGTDKAPCVGDLIRDVKYEGGYIHFKTPALFVKGNAVIAAKNINGIILWSWHIWLTDNPKSQEYSNVYKDAGYMMDRNLGATTAVPGATGSLGLLYQWGRKDPFLGSSSINSSNIASSTIQWPVPETSDSYRGTINYSIYYPTTFINPNTNNDWCYSKDGSFDSTRWTESDSPKSVYDPCPVGWRVPDGGDEGIWATARGSSYWTFDIPYYSVNRGVNFCGEFGDDYVIWYPCAGSYYDGRLISVGTIGYYWSASYASDHRVHYLSIMDGGSVFPTMSGEAYKGYSVRCVQE